MKFLILFVVKTLLLLCCVCTARRAPPMRFLEADKYLIKRNFVTGSFHYKNLSRITVPQPVRRLRLMVTLSEAASAGGFIEVFRLKIRWVGPELWWDNLQNLEENNSRFYELRCELEEENEDAPQTFLRLNVHASIDGYDENFLVRQTVPLLLRCRMRSVNGAGLFSRWIWTNTVALYRVVGHHQNHIIDGTKRRRRLLWRKPSPPIATFLGSESSRSDESNEEPEEAANTPLARRRFAMDSPLRHAAEEATRDRFSQQFAYQQAVAATDSSTLLQQVAASPSTPQPPSATQNGRRRYQPPAPPRMPQWELLNRRNTGAAGDSNEAATAAKSPPSVVAPPAPYFLRPPIEFS